MESESTQDLEVIEFSDENFGILSTQIGWCDIKCPYCGLYHSNSFIPEKLEVGRKQYTGECKRCGKKARVVMPSAEYNDRLIEHIEKGLRSLNPDPGADDSKEESAEQHSLKDF